MNLTRRLKNMLLAALILAACSAAAAVSLRLWRSAGYAEDYAAFESRVMSLEKEIISDKISSMISDIAYISYTFGIYAKLFGDEKYSKLEDNWKTYLAGKGCYYKLRYIDSAGKEKIKVNYSSKSGAYVSPLWELEDKSDRYYFNDAMQLKPNQYYISRFDLNAEKGECEQPCRLTVRVCSGVYDEYGAIAGIIVLSCDAEELLHEIGELARASAGETYLVSAKGNWVFRASRSGIQWGPKQSGGDEKPADFSAEFPEVWKDVSKAPEKPEGKITTDSGMFVYMSSPPYGVMKIGDGKTLVSPEGPMTLITFIPNDLKNGLVFGYNFANILEFAFGGKSVFFLIIISLALLTLVLSYIIYREKKKNWGYQFDALSTAYTRGAGYRKLEKLYSRHRRTKRSMCVCFIDINGLKRVNDTQGHEAGDRLIALGTRTAMRYMGPEDFIVRLGGDEFLLVFPGSDEPRVEEIWREISAEFEPAARDATGDDSVSVSHGIAAFTYGDGETVDKVIEAADERMYKEKRAKHLEQP